MKMLDDLKDAIDEIEREDEWAANFVSDILERKETAPDYKLSGKQFEKLNQIHQRFVKRW
ncbi:hypothetical protein UFOVP1165_26 [uncultured Caudovirales phage]|uniref:Uncharacterized protein n=1 Tax=uncultured Caudovirales phage TaxID=2100421 RepID=A0A6J5QUB8_9CAUD|nr:hypothetical protein UFOVP1165_26 [uncultured Caudovirales phage]